MYKIRSKNVEILLGERIIKNSITKPFDISICSFLDDFSNKLNQDRESDAYADLKELSFWCREKNILRLKIKHSSEYNRIGKGLAFHITPSNVPTNFFYSLIFQ